MRSAVLGAAVVAAFGLTVCTAAEVAATKLSTEGSSKVSAPKTTVIVVKVRDYFSSGLVLTDGGKWDIPISANGDLPYSRTVKDGIRYGITVKTQPATQTCAVIDGNGTVSPKQAAKVYVTCQNLVQNADGFVMVSKQGGPTAPMASAISTTSVADLAVTTAAASISDQFLYVPSRPDVVRVFRVNPTDGTLMEEVPPFVHPYDGFRPFFEMSDDGTVAYFAHRNLPQNVIALSVSQTDGSLMQSGAVELAMTGATDFNLSPSGKAIYVKGFSQVENCVDPPSCTFGQLGIAKNYGSEFIQLDHLQQVPGVVANSTGFTFNTAFSITDKQRSTYYYPTIGEIQRYTIETVHETLSLVDATQSNRSDVTGRLYQDRSKTHLYQVFQGFDRIVFVPNVPIEPMIGVYSVTQDGGLTALGNLFVGSSDLSQVCQSPEVVNSAITIMTPPVEDARGNFLYTSQTVNANCSGTEYFQRFGQGIYAYDISGGMDNAKPVAGSPFYAGKVNPSAFSLVRHPTKDWLYAPNNDGGSIDGYQINSTTGALTKMQGSPFGSSPSPRTGESLVKIDATGMYLYLMAPNELHAFAINQTDGTLSLIASYPLTVPQ